VSIRLTVPEMLFGTQMLSPAATGVAGRPPTVIVAAAWTRSAAVLIVVSDGSVVDASCPLSAEDMRNTMRLAMAVTVRAPSAALARSRSGLDREVFGLRFRRPADWSSGSTDSGVRIVCSGFRDSSPVASRWSETDSSVDKSLHFATSFADHPNVVPVLESGYSPDGEAYLILNRSGIPGASRQRTRHLFPRLATDTMDGDDDTTR
jgi:hypothetical protein